MKFIGLAFALFCAVAYVAAQDMQEEQMEQVRVRRQDRGSVVLKAEKPLGGPDRRPSVDIDYQRRVFERQGIDGNAYGGLSIRPGQPPNPRIGLNVEKSYKNGGFGGFGHIERGPGGRPSPVFGIGGRFNF